MSDGGCGTGAVGGVAGEFIGEQIREEIKEALKTGNISAEDLARWNSQGVDLARLGGGISAFLLGGNSESFQTGAMTGGNAAENNALMIIPIVIVLLEVADKALTAKEAYDLAKAVHEGREEEAKDIATSMSIGFVTEMLPGNKILQKIVQVLGSKKPQQMTIADDSAVGGGNLVDGKVPENNTPTNNATNVGASTPPLAQIDNPIDITNGRSGHILANHRAGTGKPGKTEFPSNWDDQRIIHQVSDIATDPSLVRQVDNRGTPFVDGTRDGLNIRVTFFPDNHPRAGQISSAYPTNVPANPRP